MVRSRLNDVVEYLRGTENHYLIFTSAGGAQAFLPDSPEWFTWLETLTSFHFKGKCGHFTARCERKRQGAYWYAYLKAHKRQHKQYLGMTEKLLLASLEETARLLHEEALGTLSAIELPIPRQEKLAVQGLTVGPLTLRWESGVLTVKTPTERHVLTRSEGAELLSYLHELRGSLLKRSDR